MMNNIGNINLLLLIKTHFNSYAEGSFKIKLQLLFTVYSLTYLKSK